MARRAEEIEEIQGQPSKGQLSTAAIEVGGEKAIKGTPRDPLQISAEDRVQYHRFQVPDNTLRRRLFGVWRRIAPVTHGRHISTNLASQESEII